jgi:hypothetical protein
MLPSFFFKLNASISMEGGINGEGKAQLWELAPPVNSFPEALHTGKNIKETSSSISFEGKFQAGERMKKSSRRCISRIGNEINLCPHFLFAKARQ